MDHPALMRQSGWRAVPALLTLLAGSDHAQRP